MRERERERDRIGLSGHADRGKAREGRKEGGDDAEGKRVRSKYAEVVHSDPPRRALIPPAFGGRVEATLSRTKANT